MPIADTTYLIGVLREKEKYFLQDDEFTRLVEAPSYEEAVHTLNETPYQKLDGLERHLADVHEWISDAVADQRLIEFISARYDALNVATCLLDRGKEEAPDVLSPLGSIRINSLASAIWRNLDWEGIPEIWESCIREVLEADAMSNDAILSLVEHTYLAWLETLAFTPLTRDVLSLAQKRAESDSVERPFVLPTKDGEVKDLSASLRDKSWDEQLLAMARKYRLAVEGYDPIYAFWLGKEVEVRTIRVLLAARLVGIGKDQVRSLIRSQYMSYV